MLMVNTTPNLFYTHDIFMCFLPFISRCDCVELCNVVHHGWLKRNLLHEHGRGGDVLDLSLQKHFVCLERKRWESSRYSQLTVKLTVIISKAN